MQNKSGDTEVTGKINTVQDGTASGATSPGTFVDAGYVDQVMDAVLSSVLLSSGTLTVSGNSTIGSMIQTGGTSTVSGGDVAVSGSVVRLRAEQLFLNGQLAWPPAALGNPAACCPFQ